MLREVIPSRAVWQVWKTIIFGAYDPSMFKRNIQALNPNFITEHPDILAPWHNTRGNEKQE